MRRRLTPRMNETGQAQARRQHSHKIRKERSPPAPISPVNETSHGWASEHCINVHSSTFTRSGCSKSMTANTRDPMSQNVAPTATHRHAGGVKTSVQPRSSHSHSVTAAISCHRVALSNILSQSGVDKAAHTDPQSAEAPP